MSLSRVEELVDWAKSQGAQLNENVELYEDPDYGIALRVQCVAESGNTDPLQSISKLDSRSILVSCPFHLSLSYLNALDQFLDLQAHGPAFPPEFISILEMDVIGHFFLMLQYLIGETSYWGPYIRSLPQPHEPEKLGTLLYFSESDMAWIRGTQLEGTREKRESKWREGWEIGRAFLDSCPGWEDWRGKWTWDLYKWAGTIFTSRSFISGLIPKELFQNQIPGRTVWEPARLAELCARDPLPVLFPVVDLANHSLTAQITWFTDVSTEPKDLSLITDSDIPVGQQIFNHYGPARNAELLVGYGFCIPGNDRVEMGLADISPAKRAALQEHHLSLGNHEDILTGRHHLYANTLVRAPGEKRLPEFAAFDDGYVDLVAFHSSNNRELEYLAKYPYCCPERSSEAVFASPLSRLILQVMSVLHDNLRKYLKRILAEGKNLG
jgi:hypothetical protein